MNGEKVKKINNLKKKINNLKKKKAGFEIFCSAGCNHLAGPRSTPRPFCSRLVLPHQNQVSVFHF